MTKIFRIFNNEKTVFAIYVLLAVAIAVQQYYFKSYNNFIIFRSSVFHFFEHQNLFLEYPNEYFDVFLYAPPFSILFIPFAYLPLLPAIIIWTVFVVSIYYIGIVKMDFKSKDKLLFLYLIIPELITSVGNLQTNPIVVALIILTMLAAGKNHLKRASIFSALNFFIKGYGGIAYVFFIFKKIRIKTLITIFISVILIFILPLIFYSLDEFLILYQQWLWSLQHDYSINTGISIMGIIKSLIYKEASVPLIQFIGVIFMLASVVNLLINKNYEQLKYIFLANILIWVVIFNQASESPTYIIASTGVFIWFFKTQRNRLIIILFVLFYVLTVLSPSDIFPSYLREHFVKPYSLKALPCVFIWILIQIQLFFPNNKIIQTITDGTKN